MARPTKPRPLSPKRRAFVREYLKDYNGTQAAIRAGYSENCANEQASDILSKPSVKEYLGRKLAALEMGSDEALRELASIARSNIQDYLTGEDIDLSKVTRAQAAAIAEFTVDATGGTGDGERKLVMRRRIKLHSKIEALKLIAQHHNLLNENRVADFTAAIMIADRLRAARKQVDAPAAHQALPDATVEAVSVAPDEHEVVGNS